MPGSVTADQIRTWIDDDLVESVERIPDSAAEFNFAVEMPNVLVHVIRRRSEGPLLIGQQIEFGADIRSRIRELTPVERHTLLTRIREAFIEIPVVYGFQNSAGANVPFEEMSMVFLEQRIYPDGLSQHTLMTGLIDIWKAMRYLDDIVSLLDTVEQ